jgi:hypothetical protein
MLGPLTRPASRITQGSAALLFAALVALAPATDARAGDTPTTTDPGLAAIGWLAQQVETDATLGAGSMADAIFAFAAVGAGQDAAATALAGMATGFDAYVLPSGTLLPGPLAKVMLAVQVQGADPNAFAGRDLEADLRGLLIVGGADDGRFGTASAFDQALAILALSRTAGGVPSTAVTWLADRQCPSGEYSFDGSCPAGPGAEDPDTTAIVIQALLAAGDTSTADAAVTWLLSIQEPSGGLPSFGIANTNSSGVGGQALRAAGETAAADAAAAFVVSLAIGCDGAAADVGAIGWAVGIPGFLVFSTPQAVLALGAPPLDELSAAGASVEAPVLDCSTVTPPPSEPAASSTAVPTPLATPSGTKGGELPDTAAGSEGGAAALLAIPLILAAASIVIARTGRRAVR